MRDLLEFLLGNGLNAFICVGQFDFSETVQDAHDLLLVNHHAVGFGQNVFQHRMNILGLRAAVLHVDVLIDHSPTQRPGAVKGQDGDNIAEIIRFEPLQKVSDPFAFELEHALLFSAAE